MKRFLSSLSLLISSHVFAVIGGQVVELDQIPQSVVKLATKNSRGVEYCTGVLIDSRTVLSAAHCLGKSKRLIHKYRPTVEMSFFIDGVERTYQSIDYLVHPDYESHEKADLALIYLAFPLELASYPVLSEIQSNDQLHVLGFGLHEHSDRIDGKLRQTFIEVESIHQRYFTSTNKDTGPCSGDSGGAVFRAGTESEEILGITYYINPSLTRTDEAPSSFNQHCFNATSYFMNTALYALWIDKHRKGRP
jgi:secreted trypsin-like serine protease